MIYDSLLLIGVLFLALLLPHVLLGMLANLTAPRWLLALHLFVVLGCYFVGYWRYSGQTLAMQTWRLRIASAAGGPPLLRQLILRYLMAWPSLTFYGAGLIWALFDRERLFLHERLSGTRLVMTMPEQTA